MTRYISILLTFARACLVRDMTISGAALDVAESRDIPEHFNLVFKADGTPIPCHVVWRQEERIGVAFD